MRTPRQGGFTLIEVLVAVVIMAIMSLMAWQGVDGIVRARDANQLRLEQTLRLETVVAQWEQDLASLQETSAVPASYILADESQRARNVVASAGSWVSSIAPPGCLGGRRVLRPRL